ncbi:crossover junction endonuclease EME1 isoform X3 [Ursus americanus]|uniref:crossover junction endonuclease EME1 isoform X3 n=1 Tax=Ursus americanus TaxID=9643 RepID=UPI001E679A6E|nr:crossover junction endonuclease EME1 isoform X3 [Ursus americanus]
MALKKSSLSQGSSESDSEELPTFTFLKKKPSSTKRRQPQREEKIVVVVTSDSEASCPPSPRLKAVPPIPDTAEPVTQTEPVRVLSSESEDGEELMPLAERLACKFLTRKQLSPEDSSSPVKNVWDHQNSEGASCDWKKQPFPKVTDLPLHDTSERHASNNKDPAGDNPHHQLPAFKVTCPVQDSSWTVTRTDAEVPPLQKRTRHSQKVQRGGSQGCQPRRQASQERALRQQERTKKTALVNRLKAQRPEECLKHVIVGLDPGPPSIRLHPGLRYLLPGPLPDRLSPIICCSAFAGGRGRPAPRGAAVHGVPLCDRGAGRAVQYHLEEKGRSSRGWTGGLGGGTDGPGAAPGGGVCAHGPELQGSLGGPEKGRETLRSFVTDATARAAGKALSLVIVDQEKCFSAPNPPRRRKQGVAERGQAKEKQQRRPEAIAGHVVSRVDVEEALVDLQLYMQAQARVVRSWKELADFACAFTKAVAEAPFKKLRDQTSFSFCLESDWAGGAKVDRAGRGLALVWRRQIQQLNRVSLDMASAIVDTYPSPQLLVQTVQTDASPGGAG